MFSLTIQLGNEAMRTPRDVARSLYRLADHLNDGGDSDGYVRDDNGNTVGRWTAEWPIVGDDE